VAPSSVQLIVDAGGALNPIRQVQRASQALSAQFEKLKGSAANAARGAVDLGRTLDKNTEKLRAQTTSVQGLIGAYAGFRTLKGAITAGVELETAEKRAELLTQRFAQLSGIQGVAAQSADKFRIAQSDTLAALIDLGNRLGPQGASLAEIRDVYDGFNTVLAINKVSTQEAASAQLQLNQALGSGRLAGEEFRAVNEATPQVIDAVAKILGVARGEVKQLAADGAVTAPVLIQALRDIKNKGADVLEASFDSASGRLRAFQKAQTELSQAIGLQLLPAFTPLLSATTELIKKFAALPGPAKAVIAGVVGITTALIALAPVITGAIGLLKALGVATLVAAGPWVALAAGITAAAVALASYQTQAQKTAKGAASGDAAAIKKANDELYVVNQKITKTVAARAEATGRERASLDRQVQALRRDQAELQKGLTAGRKVETAQDLTGGLVTGAPTGEEDKKKGKTKKERESRLPELTRELALAQDIFDIQGRVLQARAAENDALITTRQTQLELRQITDQIAAVRADKELPEAEKLKQIAALELQSKTAGRQLAFDLAQQEKEKAKNAADAIQRLTDEQALLQAKLNGNEAEVMLTQQIRDLKKQYPALNEADAKTIIESTNKLKEQIAVADQMKQVYADIGSSIKSGVVDAISSAVDGTKTLAEVASNTLRTIANRLLDVAVNMALFGALSGTGTGGGLLGGLFKRANGGSVMSGQSYLVGERGPELFTPGRSGGIAPSGSFGGVGNVTVNVDASGSNVEGNADQANQLGKAIGLAVQQELIKQKRPGGLLA
jgi:tape measure domain-containing protein